MMRIAFDSSALAKRYVAEAGTERVLELCAQASQVILSVLCIPEIISGLNRLRREKGLSRRKYRSLKKDLAADVSQALLVPISETVLVVAIRALEGAPLRALDALHTATALDSSCDLFVSADTRQCKAARSLGLQVQQIAP